ncbi:MAG TPA: hypothetical protein VGO47_00860, partial [Chlamydiales bacterium]|nr:hypothetical protein [Chlamydiales bacterium]
ASPFPSPLGSSLPSPIERQPIRPTLHPIQPAACPADSSVPSPIERWPVQTLLNSTQPLASPADSTARVDAWLTPRTDSAGTPMQDMQKKPRGPNFLQTGGKDAISTATPCTKRLLQDAQYSYKTMLMTRQPFPEAEHLKYKFAKESWDVAHEAYGPDDGVNIKCDERVVNLVLFFVFSMLCC